MNREAGKGGQTKGCNNKRMDYEDGRSRRANVRKGRIFEVWEGEGVARGEMTHSIVDQRKRG